MTSSEIATPETYFQATGSIRSRLTILVLVGMAAFGAGALRFTSSRTTRGVLIGSVSLLLVTTAAIATSVRVSPHRRRTYDVALAVALALTVPIVWVLDFFGPTVGIVIALLILQNLDAPARVRVGTVALVGALHVAMHGFMVVGWLPNAGMLGASLPLTAKLSNLGSTTLLYALALVVPRIYRRRTGKHLEELAEAGRAIAARDALVREARSDLERIAKIGERGRFTDQVLGSFVLGSLLGRGGMGEVYEGTHVKTGERAAVKLLRPSALEAPQDVHRFVRESAIVRALSSPHVVRIFEVGGMEAPLPYIAMERLEGNDLAAILRSRPLAPREVADMVEQIAEGLIEAKRHSVVHRDIKPSNLFRDEAGVWKILDFGIGTLAGRSGTLTAGAIVGTFGYMAPEQLDGQGTITHRTDLYALALVVYRALTGTVAFLARNPAEAIREIDSELPVRPSDLVNVPHAVDHVLRVAFAKSPTDRFDDVETFAKALARALNGVSDPAIETRSAALDQRLTWRRAPAAEHSPAPPVGVPPTARTEKLPPPGPPNGEPATEKLTNPSGPVKRPASTGEPTSPARSSGPSTSVETTLHPFDEATERLGDGAMPSRGSGAPKIGASGPVTLVASGRDVFRSLSLARTRVLAPTLALCVLFALTQLPLHPDRRMWPFGVAATVLLTTALSCIGLLAAQTSEASTRWRNVMALLAAIAASGLAFYFQVAGIVHAFIGVALLLFALGEVDRWATLPVLGVAIPSVAIHLGITFGVIQERGITVFEGGTPARLWNLAHLVALYVLAFVVGRVIRERTLRMMSQLGGAFRRLAEREALLQEARLELERVVGARRSGRFTGETIGHYVLGLLLGHGGMGEVYAATDVVSGEPVAVKLLLSKDSDDHRTRAVRLWNEGRFAKQIASPYVVRVLEIGHGSGELALPFIAMERLNGGDLGVILLQRLTLDPREIVTMTRQIAAALDGAHRASVVHLDVKPSNIFLTHEGVWKLLDFGVATLAGEHTVVDATIAGTPAFMSPEQLAGDVPFDGRSDVHALAVVVYRALTGHPAFSGRTAIGVAQRVLGSLPERPSRLVAVPSAVDDVLRIAMAKSPHERFDDAPSFARALAEALDGREDDDLTARAAILDRTLSWGQAVVNSAASSGGSRTA